MRLDSAFVGFHETLHYRQTQPKSAVGSLARRSFLHEEIEDAPKRVGSDPDTRVANAHHDAVLLARRPHRNLAPRWRVLGSIGQQIRHDLAEAYRVPEHGEPGLRHIHRECVLLLLEERSAHFDGVRDDVSHLDLALSSSILPRVIRATSSRSPTRRVKWAAWRSMIIRSRSMLSPGAKLHQSQRGHDRGQRVSQLMPEHGEEVVLGAIGGFCAQTRVTLGIRQGRTVLLRAISFCHVTKDHHDAVDSAVRCPDRRGAVINGSLPSILGHEHGVIRESGNDAVPENASNRLLGGLTGLRMDEREHLFDVPTHRVGDCPPCERFRHWIEFGHSAAIVRDDHSVANACQRHVEALREPRRTPPFIASRTAPKKRPARASRDRAAVNDAAARARRYSL